MRTSRGDIVVRFDVLEEKSLNQTIPLPLVFGGEAAGGETSFEIRVEGLVPGLMTYNSVNRTIDFSNLGWNSVGRHPTKLIIVDKARQKSLEESVDFVVVGEGRQVPTFEPIYEIVETEEAATERAKEEREAATAVARTERFEGYLALVEAYSASLKS